MHSRSNPSVGSISRRLRSSSTIRNISQPSFMDSKWSRLSPMTCTIFTIPQACSSFRLVLTFERATASVSANSSARNGFSETYNSAWIWATVRLMPQRVPISPQCRTNFWRTGDKSFIRFCLFRNYRILQRCQAPFSESHPVRPGHRSVPPGARTPVRGNGQAAREPRLVRERRRQTNRAANPGGMNSALRPLSDDSHRDLELRAFPELGVWDLGFSFQGSLLPKLQIPEPGRRLRRGRRRRAPGQKSVVRAIVAIEVQPPAGPRGRRRRGQRLQRNAHDNPPDPRRPVDLRVRLKPAVPFEALRASSQFQVQPLTVRRHLELKIMLRVVR